MPYQLTTAQCSDLIDRYVELCIDSMDHKDMYSFVSQTLTEDFSNLSEDELLTEIEYSFDKEVLDELVGSVTTVTYGIEPGESLSFPVHQKSAAQDSWETVTHFSYLGRLRVYNKDMNKSNLQEFFPSLLEKGYTVREINESCQSHLKREVPNDFKNRYSTYEEYLEAISDFMNGL